MDARTLKPLRGAVIGCGFFGRNHIQGWREVAGAEIVAVCDQDPARARAWGTEFGAVPYSDAAEMLRRERLDFVDIITQPETHRPLVELCARAGKHVICQKPMAFHLDDARAMVAACDAAGVRFMVHENFRWQLPNRVLREESRRLGSPVFGRVAWWTGFDIYTNQPYLLEQPRLVIMDMGVHILDLARFFFGEFTQLYCQVGRLEPRAKGEDVALILLKAESGATCSVELSYGSRITPDPFPETLARLESSGASVELRPVRRITVDTAETLRGFEVELPAYAWSDPRFLTVQDSVVRIQQHWVECLREGREPETSGRDNLKTLELVHAAYRSAESGEVVKL